MSTAATPPRPSPAERAPSAVPATSSLHVRVIETIGQRIVSGVYARGTVLRSDEIGDELEVSRTVVREAMRVLESLGLIATVKRVGIRVLPMSRWNLLSPTVIRWRLASDARGAQLRSMSELRAAVEPHAVELAALHRSDALATTLVGLAAKMRVVGRAGDLTTFGELDVEYHRLILVASGNELYAQLDDLIGEVLRGRTDHGLMPVRPHEEALMLHAAVADAILDRRADDARDAMSRIIARTIEEMDEMWRDDPRIELLGRSSH